MRIGWDVFSFDPPGRNYGVGPGVVVWRLLPELIKAAPGIEFIVFTNRENGHLVPQAQNVRVVESPIDNRRRLLRLRHEQLWLPAQVKKQRLDLLHCFGNNIPWRAGSKSILLVHDLMWKYYLRQGDTALKWRYFQLTVPVSLRRARGIVAVSAATKQELVALGINPTKIVVIHNGSGSQWEAPSEQEAQALQAAHPTPYLLTLTTSMPHKNLQRLLEAYRDWSLTDASAGPLLIAGQLKGDYHHTTRAFIEANGLSDRVRLLGFVAEGTKTWLYRHARLVIYPSLYEGFGLPVLEAMEAGVPVVTSRVASIPEVGGDACLYFDPHDVHSISEALVTGWHDEQLREQLIAAGKAQADTFSWQRAAAENLAFYRQLLAS